ncbi:MAG: hypothetical protein HY329_23725 [Chloroflexi bacterium]|nr:hypothetical protein [Chloroflexota bacterium]
MAKDVLAELVVREVRGMLQPYSDAELLDVTDGVATVRYRKGRHPDCADCIMTPDDLSEMLLSLFARKAPKVKELKLEVVEV